MNWPRLEDDFMEYGDTGWVALGEGKYQNIYTRYIMDANGILFDEYGNVIPELEEK
jgi:hypothetical protein